MPDVHTRSTACWHNLHVHAPPPLRVLLVEDNAFTRSTVAASLEGEGIDVVAAVGSAREAVDAARRSPFDCAVIDLNLGPGPTGLDLAHGLRKARPGLPLVILTSYEDPRLLAGSQRPVPDGAVYVVKNDVRSTDELRTHIERACGVGDSAGRTAPARVPLTDTQVELLQLVAEGLSNAEIARRRFTSERAVETALARIAQRLGVEHDAAVNTRVRLTQAYLGMIGGGGGR